MTKWTSISFFFHFFPVALTFARQEPFMCYWLSMQDLPIIFADIGFARFNIRLTISNGANQQNALIAAMDVAGVSGVNRVDK